MKARTPAVLFLLLSTVLAGACAPRAPVFRPVAGFSDEANGKLRSFLEASRAETGRRVAVFDGDGTTLGQAPHYLADECLYQHAQAHPGRKPELIAEMRAKNNVSISYVQDRVRYLAGMTVEEVRALGEACFARDYADKIFIPMRELIGQLVEFGFEVWVVTGSPEVMYQGFLSRQLGIPLLHVVGVKSVVHGGVVSDRIVLPVPQDEGKKEAIETVIQAVPLFVAGNSRGDREMIEFSRGLRLIVNPDEHVEEGQTESIAQVAQRGGWLTVRIRDVPAPGFPAVSSKVYGIRQNKTRE